MKLRLSRNYAARWGCGRSFSRQRPHRRAQRATRAHGGSMETKLEKVARIAEQISMLERLMRRNSVGRESIDVLVNYEKNKALGCALKALLEELSEALKVLISD